MWGRGHVWMGILEVRGVVCRKEGEMKGHVVTAAFPGMHHAQTSGTKPLNDVIVQSVGQFACQVSLTLCNQTQKFIKV